ncbi:DUF5676 family membrane protein [Stanieria cyanosphaera]|uniref:DUF5676 family membrane protein n=1 Tax=Stanieria cyanosphaera TaxID=102116 RepID=UPI0009005C7D|nr:DUF5676 family membrane protein [Stanieria cyanosphaera]
MTSHTHHPGTHHINRSTTRLRMRSLFIATAVMSAVAYTICVVFIVLAPQATIGFFGYILHADLSNIARSVSFGSFIVGLLAWSLGTGLYAALIARLYNQISSRV